MAFYYVQFRRDKKEAWKLVDENDQLDHPPAFKTVLSLSGDPSAYAAEGIAAEDVIKYFGPMYFDLDGEGEIDEVLEAARGIVKSLTTEHNIPAEAIQAFLSGKKGVHLLVHPGVFGVTKARLLLPLVWKRFALKFDSKFVDRSVYSMGKGRIWRCCNIKRPDSGTYKVQIPLSELAEMTASAYAEAVKTTRPETAFAEVVQPIPALVAFVDAATAAARKEIKDRKRALDSVTVNDLRSVPGIPGCIEMLITQGDCPDSNWNQAAMQLAGYIAGRYHRDEEAEEYGELVEKFLENITSSSRPAKADREKELQAQLDRAFSGATKFSAGGIIRALGSSCGHCVICSRKSALAKAEGEPADGHFYDEATSIRVTPDGIFMVGKDSSKLILNCGMQQTLSYVEFKKHEEWVVSGAYILSGGEIESTRTVEIDEEAFNDRRRFCQVFSGSGAVFEGNESELQKLYRTISRLRKGIEKMIRTTRAGILFRETEDGIFPSLVTRDEAYRKGQVPSEYVYSGPLAFAPTFANVPDFSTQDEVADMVTTLRAVFEMNEPGLMIPAIGWTMACHLKTHLTHADRSFPMLNLCGTSHTGKSSTAFLLLALNAFPYRKAPVWNAEVDTIYPLEEMVTTSTTFIRTIEEANETNAKRNWPKLVGILKGSWDEAGIMKGAIKGRTTVTETRANSAPIMYLSEQAFPIQSIRTRSIECLFSSKSIEDPVYGAAHALAVAGTRRLEMLAKVLANTALNLTMTQVNEWRKRATDLLPSDFMGRTRTSYEVVLVGLLFLAYVVQFYDKEMAAYVNDRIDDYARELEKGKDDTLAEKRISAIAEMLMSLDQMAMEHENQQHGLKPGLHYWATPTAVYLDARSVFPRYQRYMKGVGREAQIHSYVQMMKLLRGEAYYKGTIRSPENPSTQLIHLDVSGMAVRGVEFPHFLEQALA